MQDVTEGCRSIMGYFGAVWNVMGALQSSYGTLQNHYRKYWFAHHLL